MAMALTVELLRARIPFIASAVFLVFALSDHLRLTSDSRTELTSVTEKLKTERCQAPLLTSVVDYDLDAASQETLRMLDNYFTTLRAHSKIEFVALASSEERCERVKQRWGEACRVFHLGEYRWTKQLIGREILAMLRESRRPVVLVDTDVRVGLDPEPLLAKLSCDFGVDFAGGDEAKWNINTGFLFFAPTPVAESIATCVVDWIDLVRSDVDGAFKKYVLDTVPEDARIEGKSDVRRANATEMSFEQDVVKDCARNAVTNETEMRFSVHIARKAVAGTVDFAEDVHLDVPPPGGGIGWYDGSKCNPVVRAAGEIRCATTHDKQGMLAVVRLPIYHSQMAMRADEHAAFRHCIGKEPACLYEGN